MDESHVAIRESARITALIALVSRR
jgi:hypothetical protein